MSAKATGIFIVGAKRTPFGRYGGTLKDVAPADMMAVAAKEALKQAKVSPEMVDTVNVGNVNTNSTSDGANAARHSSLKTGIPIEKPALLVNRACGSGFQAIVNAAQDIMTGAAKISLTGGTENMSLVPFSVRNIRFGIPLGANIEFEDSLFKSVTDTYCNFNMGQTAENLAEKYKLKREEVDQFSYQSQQRYKAALDAGLFKEELVPVTVQQKKKEVIFALDEHPRAETTLEGLSKLPSVFKTNGVVTAGTASGINDGAGAVVVASEEALKQNNLTPLARVVAWSTVGVEPSIMGIGPAPAIQNILKLTNLKLDDIDLIEINEAFAAQTLACAKELNLDHSKLNVNGGAIAVGHPVAASGARITAHLVYELRRRGLKRAIGSACIGGGQGIALLLEAV